ncbi:hypothetical protein GNZ12_43330 [Paraburkholderia sp. 1N]|uniref:Uncharacterized protein n=1 Tax=Paraburkholderia solitsugae TaxID=2675748 RepID=A0ABX2C4R3_9BURK|nr:hypothetical protein [Paraburkholderia solitsugae]NPT48006.1 hypothetical protein [Paraburkholderia solitsugae]
MTQTFEYQGFTIVVDVEADFGWERIASLTQGTGFVSTVRILRAGTALALFSPLRFGDDGGRPFATEADALIGGYSAAQKIVDDLFSQPPH